MKREDFQFCHLHALMAAIFLLVSVIGLWQFRPAAEAGIKGYGEQIVLQALAHKAQK